MTLIRVIVAKFESKVNLKCIIKTSKFSAQQEATNFKTAAFWSKSKSVSSWTSCSQTLMPLEPALVTIFFAKRIKTSRSARRPASRSYHKSLLSRRIRTPCSVLCTKMLGVATVGSRLQHRKSSRNNLRTASPTTSSTPTSHLSHRRGASFRRPKP